MMGGRGWDRFYTQRHPMMRGGRGFGPGWENDDFGAGPMMGNGFGVGPGFQAVAVEPLTVDQARTAAEQYVEEQDIEGLEVGEIMIFDNHAYVVIKEAGTGLGAFEVLVEPASKTAYPEHGANMMWNLKYGALNHANMMGTRGGRGMMGGAWAYGDAAPAEVDAEMQLDESEALATAQEFLDAHLQGYQVAESGIAFYGYYTFDYEKDGMVAGMLSVNGESGAVILHRWHGAFVEESE